jgi:inorganic pyrophosphatase
MRPAAYWRRIDVLNLLLAHPSDCMSVQAFGDNDPVDIVEIGSAAIPRGAVVQAPFPITMRMCRIT